jgi:ABC-type dipeptide/oligopeptide/nickel transport system permease component
VIVVLGETFIIRQAAPSDPAQMKYICMDMTPTPELMEQTREEMGLNYPVIVQYFRWLGQVCQGNLGESTKFSESVFVQMTKKLPITLELAGISGAVMIVIAFPLGILMAVKKNKAMEYCNEHYLEWFGWLGYNQCQTDCGRQFPCYGAVIRGN